MQTKNHKFFTLVSILESPFMCHEISLSYKNSYLKNSVTQHLDIKNTRTRPLNVNLMSVLDTNIFFLSLDRLLYPFNFIFFRIQKALTAILVWFTEKATIFPL
jgi:hypothetical protein